MIISIVLTEKERWLRFEKLGSKFKYFMRNFLSNKIETCRVKTNYLNLKFHIYFNNSTQSAGTSSEQVRARDVETRRYIYRILALRGYLKVVYSDQDDYLASFFYCAPRSCMTEDSYR